jgi:hypothetical protein
MFKWERRNRRIDSIAVFATTMGSIFPALVVLNLFSFVLRARLQLGRWPEPYRPDPKSLGFDFHHDQIFFGLVAVLPVAMVTFFGLVFTRKVAERFSVRLMVYLVPLAGMIVWWMCDPGHFLEWFLD